MARLLAMPSVLKSGGKPNALQRCAGYIVAALLFAALAVAPRTAIADGPAELKNVGFDQHLDSQVPLDLPFTDESGKEVKLREYFGDKPVIVVLAYYRCPMLCTLVLNGLVQGMREMPFTAGRDFQVVVVSFDPQEKPPLAAMKKKNYVGQYGRPGAEDAMHFLTGKPEPIAALTHALGFRYVYDKLQQQYIHTSGIVVLTPDGKISRYFFGIHFSGQDLRLGLVEASQGRIGSTSDQVLLYCFHYDPALGKYSASVLNFVRAGGVFTIVLLVGLVWYLLKREPYRRASVPPAPQYTAGGTPAPQSVTDGTPALREGAFQ
jgi:protein SCO1/2